MGTGIATPRRLHTYVELEGVAGFARGGGIYVHVHACGRGPIMHCTREVMLERDYKEIVRFLESNTFRRGSLQLVASQFPQYVSSTLHSQP